jgi:hypothetical protein
LLALAVNTPFFPPDLYDDAPPYRILEDAWDEHRIRVFESVLNSGGFSKVAFPGDLETVEEAVDRVADDATMVPMPVEGGNRFDDEFATLRRKHGTYWRWVRPVFDGATRSSANARIEFRPIPAQPTVRDSVAFQAAFAGLMESLVRREHPVADLPWEAARENFYAATEDGIDADLRWVTHAGAETTDPREIFDDVLAHAADGLEAAGCPSGVVRRYLAPLRDRVDHGRTPADWKRENVRERLEAGASLEAAIYGMQQDYVGRQTETLVGGSFADWE